MIVLLVILSDGNVKAIGMPSPDVKETVGDKLDKGKKKVVNAFNSIKNKISHKSDSTEVEEEVVKDKGKSFKSKKVHEKYPQFNERYYWTNRHKYKGSDKTELEFGFSGEITYDTKSKTTSEKIYIYYMIYGHKNSITIPKGSEILIRTGNDKVYKAVTLTSFANSSQLSNIGHFSAADNQYHLYGVETTYTNLEPDFYLSPEAIKDILEYGIIKVRIGRNDLKLEDKSFEKGNNEIKDYLKSLQAKMAKQKEAWTLKPPKPYITNQVEEF
ncbi:MAG: hypothetical protein J1E38_07865 [Paramuribaculum sp.]|nr:hypothetical protein [Paramuribaculum sp.]